MKTEVMKHEQFGEVRTVILDAEKFFAGRDVAAALGYKKPNNFLNKHVAKEDKRTVLLRALHSPIVAPTVVINKNGVAALCAAAFCDDAADIKEWLLKEDKARPDALKLFDDAEYGQFRWIIIDGEVWFVAADMCRILGFVNVTTALYNLDDDEKRKIPEIGVTTDPSLSEGSTTTPFFHEINVINEFGVYRLTMQSTKPHAKNFQRKVYHEILPSIRKHGYYSVKGEEPHVKKIRKPLPEYAVVYTALLDNALVKIGLTTDFNRRIKEVRKETGLDVEDVFTTDFMPLDDARKLESTVKAKFHEKNKGGELYDAPFELVKAALLDKHVDSFDKLLALAREMQPSPEKNQLLLQAANLLK